jgi:opacity protein-like surface antigen
MVKKVFLFAGLFLIFMSAANAQDIFRKGTQFVNAGLGLGSYIPVEVSYERSILDGLIKGENGAIGVGAYLGYYGDTEYDWRYNHYVLGARGAFHYQFIPKLDTYGGLMLGYNIASVKWVGDGESTGTASASAFGYALFVGGRYFFKPNLGVYSEIGYGIAYLSAGVTLKF